MLTESGLDFFIQIMKPNGAGFSKIFGKLQSCGNYKHEHLVDNRYLWSTRAAGDHSSVVIVA